MTPSEVLVRAADLIRDTAAAATDAPWATVAMRDHSFSVWSSNTSFEGEDEEVANSPIEPDARWIALMSPAVAGPIEQVFRAMVPAAEQAEAIPRESARVYPKGFHAVLALARAVLGEKEDADG